MRTPEATVIVVATISILLIVCAVYGTIGAVAYHFISKFW